MFRVPAVLGVDLSGITDTDGVTNIATTATYKWQRFNAAGTTLETDSIGTGSTYTLTDTDATKTLKVVVRLHRRRHQQRGTADQRRNLSHHSGSDRLQHPHLRWRSDPARASQEGGG